MFGAVLFCVTTSLCAVWAWLVYVKDRKHKLPPMYPGLLPIIGHLHILIGYGFSLWNVLQLLVAEATKRGGVISICLGYRVYYLITDPEDALTAANACLKKHFAYNYAKAWLGDGLITSSGEIWKHHRKLLSPTFSLPVIHSFMDIFNTQARKLVQNFKAEVGKGPFDHTVYLKSIALETFCLTAFGMTTMEDKHFIEKYMHAVDEILKLVTSRFQKFWLQSDIMYKLCGVKKQHDEYAKILNDMSNKVIQQKKLERRNGLGDTSDTKFKPLLDLLMDASEGNALSDKEIREEVDTAIVTGFDTTSNLLNYTLFLLGTHPEVQEKMYQEIKEVFPTDRDVGKGDYHKLVYTEAVLKESLRIFTTGPVTLRYVDKDVKLKNYTMRAGSQCVVLLIGVHRDAVWGKDADQFRPERWFDAGMPAYPSGFVGFSLGKRSCPGRTYAMITMKTTMVHFLKTYKVTADASKLQLRFDFMLKPVSGHEISLEERA